MRLPAALGLGTANRWVGSLVKRSRLNQSISCINEKYPFNNVLDLSDLCKFIESLLGRRDWPNFEAFPLASKDPILVSRVLNIISECTGSEAQIDFLGDRPPHFVIDYSYARKNNSYRSIQRRPLEHSHH